MNPAHAENVRNIFLCHLNDQTGIRRLIHGCYNVNRPDKACQPVMLFLDSHLSYNGREIGLTRLLMD